MQLIFLVDASLLDAVPALLLCDAQSTGDVVPKVEPLLFGQVVGWGIEYLGKPQPVHPTGPRHPGTG